MMFSHRCHPSCFSAFFAAVCLLLTLPATAKVVIRDRPASEAGVEPVEGLRESSAITYSEYCKVVAGWLRGEIVASYERTASDPSELSSRVSDWLTQYVRARSDQGGAPSWEELHRRGEAIADTGCDHPVFLSCLAELDLEEGRLRRSRMRHDAIQSKLLSGEYGSANRYLEAVRLMRLSYHWGRTKRYEAEKRAAECWLKLAAETEDPLLQRAVWNELEHLTNGRDGAWDREWLAGLLASSSGDPRLQPWIARMVAGQAAYLKAWNARGGKFAGEVHDKQWDFFYDGIAEAGERFRDAHFVAPDRPEAATMMIQVSRDTQGTDLAQVRHWFDLARSAQYDHLPAYRAMLNASRARWHGGSQELWNTAVRWSKEGLESSNAGYMVPRAVYDLGKDLKSRRRALKPEPAYDLVMRTLQLMADDPAHSKSRKRLYTRATLLSHRVAVAMKVRRDEEARKAYDSLSAEGLDFDETVLRGYGQAPWRKVARMLARTGPAGEEVRRLGKLSWEQLHADEESAAEGAARYAAAKRLANDPRTAPYLDHRLIRQELERDLYSGKPVSPTFSSRFAGWDLPSKGLWQVEGNRAVVARSAERAGFPKLQSDFECGEAFEVAVDIEPIFEAGDSALSGVYIDADPQGYYFWINQTSLIANATPVAECSTARRIPEQQRYRMTVRVRPGQFQMFIDGTEVAAKEFEDREQFVPSGSFSLGLVPAAHGAEIRFRNPRVKRLLMASTQESGDLGSRGE